MPRQRSLTPLAAALVMLGASSVAFAEPVEVVHAGRLLDARGSALQGERTVTVALFDAADGGEALWSADYDLSLDAGYYSVVLGAAGDLDSSLLAGPRWVQLSADELQLGGRRPLQPVPQAVHALHADSLGDAASAGPNSSLRIGNTLLNAFSAGLPHDFGAGSSYSGALQLETTWSCSNAVSHSYMWQVEFAGHDFNTDSPFRVVTVGYSTSSYADLIQDVGTTVDYGPIGVVTYCSSNGFVSFELTRSTSAWHASDLTINLLHGGSGYQRSATDDWGVRGLASGSRI